MWDCEKISSELDKKIKDMNFITYRDIINQSVTQFKKGIPFNEQVFKWVYCRETGLQELVIHNMVNFCLVNNIKYLDDKFYFATTCYDWKTGEITTFKNSPRKPDDIEELGIKELEKFKYDFIPSDQKDGIIWHQDGCCDCGFYISCKIENEWLIFYYMKDSFIGCHRPYHMKAINRHLYESSDIWRLTVKIDYSAPGFGYLQLENTHRRPAGFERKVSVI